MTEPKRGRGRPKSGARYSIQKHIFLDDETAAMLRQLGQGNESAYIRDMIRREFKKRKPNS